MLQRMIDDEVYMLYIHAVMIEFSWTQPCFHFFYKNKDVITVNDAFFSLAGAKRRNISLIVVAAAFHVHLFSVFSVRTKK